MGSGHHGDDRDPARRPGGLYPKEIPEVLPQRVGHALEDRQIRGKAAEAMRARETKLDSFEFVLRRRRSVAELAD